MKRSPKPCTASRRLHVGESQTGSAFIASHSQSDHPRFPPFSGTLSSVDGHNLSSNSISGVLVAIKVEKSSLLYRELENRIPEGGQTVALERFDRATDVATHRLKHHLNRYPVPDVTSWLIQLHRGNQPHGQSGIPQMTDDNSDLVRYADWRFASGQDP